MTNEILGIGLVCFSASLGALVLAFHYKPLALGRDEKIISDAQWARLRQRAAAERRAAPPRSGGAFKRPTVH